MKRFLIGLLFALALLAAGLVYFGKLPTALATRVADWKSAKVEVAKKPAPVAPSIAVTAVRAAPADFIEVTSVSGTLVARDEILVGPEIEGLRVIELLAEEGDRVKKGQVLARLVNDTLDAQLAQNDAGLARTAASIASAKAQVAQAEARLAEARAAYERSQSLKKSGHTSESAFEQKLANARAAEAQLASANDMVRSVEAERAQVEAQRRELTWRRSRTDVVAPADGVISRRTARVGAMAAGAAEPMFRLLARGEVDLEAEVPEILIARLKAGQPARINAAGSGEHKGRVRLVAPEIDRATRLGKVKIFIGDDERLRVGAFARAEIESARSRGLAVPVSAVLYSDDATVVQVIEADRIRTRRVVLGLVSGSNVEVREGLAEGDMIVAKSGTFLRDGDLVRAIAAQQAAAKEAGR